MVEMLVMVVKFASMSMKTRPIYCSLRAGKCAVEKEALKVSTGRLVQEEKVGREDKASHGNSILLYS
jgi:hypothetical protein